MLELWAYVFGRSTLRRLAIQHRLPLGKAARRTRMRRRNRENTIRRLQVDVAEYEAWDMVTNDLLNFSRGQVKKLCEISDAESADKKSSKRGTANSRSITLNSRAIAMDTKINTARHASGLITVWPVAKD